MRCEQPLELRGHRTPKPHRDAPIWTFPGGLEDKGGTTEPKDVSPRWGESPPAMWQLPCVLLPRGTNRSWVNPEDIAAAWDAPPQCCAQTLLPPGVIPTLQPPSCLVTPLPTRAVLQAAAAAAEVCARAARSGAGATGASSAQTSPGTALVKRGGQASSPPRAEHSFPPLLLN